jgi:hypothetical protein
MSEILKVGGSGDAVDKAVMELLHEVPEAWAELEHDGLTAVEQEALRLLTAAGMVERRFSIRLLLIGHPVQIDVTVTATGEHGLAQAMEPVLRKSWDAWAKFYRAHRDGPEEDRPKVFCENTGPDMWRLTKDGVLARQDLEDGRAKTVLDFVQRRTAVFYRRVIPGFGRTERLDTTRESDKPAKVEVTNLGELSGPIKEMIAAFQSGLEKMATAAPQSPQKNAAPARHLPKPKVSSDPPKRSWTQPDLDSAIREYKANRSASFQQFVSLLDNPDTPASRKRTLRKQAGAMFGRNVIAKALGVKSAKMVSQSQPWIVLAEVLGLPRRAGKMAGPGRPKTRLGEEIAAEQASMSAADTAEHAAADAGILRGEREETLRQIRKLAESELPEAKPQAKALFDRYEAGEMTDDQVRGAIETLKTPV